MSVYYLIPFIALLVSERFNQKFFILKDISLSILYPFLIAGILWKLFFSRNKENRIGFTRSDFLIVLGFAILSFHYYFFRRYLETIISFHHLQFLLLLFIYMKFYDFSLDSDRRKTVFVSASIVLCLMTVAERICYPDSRLLLQSTFGNPSYTSAYLLLMSPIVLSIQNRVLKTVLLATMVAGLVILGSRIALVLLCMQLLYLYMGEVRRTVPVVLIVITFFLCLNPARLDFSSEPFRKNMVYRSEVLRTSMRMVPDSFFYGQGNSFVKYNFHRYYENSGKRKVSYLNTYHLHCDPLEFLVEYGWVFLLVCSAVLLMVLRKKDFLSVSVASLVLYSLFSFPFRFCAIYSVFFLFVFHLSNCSRNLIEVDLGKYGSKFLMTLVCALFCANFWISTLFFRMYAGCDMAVKQYNLRQDQQSFELLKGCFRQMPYYYELSYRYGIACMRKDQFNTALKVLLHVKTLRDEQSVRKNLNEVLKRISIQKF